MNYFSKYRYSLIRISIFILAVILMFLFFNYLLRYTVPFLIGWIISLLLNPIVNIFNKLKIPRTTSVLAALILLCLLIVLLGNSVVKKIADEGSLLINNMPYYKVQLINIAKIWEIKMAGFYRLFPIEIHNVIDMILSNILESLTSLLSMTVQRSSLIVSIIPNIFIYLITTLISTFFFLKDKDIINNFILNQIPKSWKKTFSVAIQGIITALGGYIKAQLIIMCFTVSLCIIGLFILHYPYALLIGSIIGILDAFPLLGSGIILLPWSLINLAAGNYKFAVGLIIIYLIVLIQRQILEPKIVAKQIGIHPLVTLISVFWGMKIFGIWGFILGPVIVITIKTLQKENILPQWN